MATISKNLPKVLEMKCFSIIQENQESLTLEHMLLYPDEYRKEIGEELLNIVLNGDSLEENEELIQFVLLNYFNERFNIFDTILKDEEIEENENIPVIHLKTEIPLIVENKKTEKVDYLDLTEYIVL
jgi:hypothetical protein